MRRSWIVGAALAAVLLAAAAPARAEHLDTRGLLRQAEAFVGSLFGRRAPDHEVIRPPRDIDPQMALRPPRRGTMRVISPPEGRR